MRRIIQRIFLGLASFGIFSFGLAQAETIEDPLPSWNDNVNKSAIVDFVNRVTTENSADFVPPAERIATFDNDGTLWSEQPLYFQGYFALSQIRAMSKDHPEWATTEPFRRPWTETSRA